MKESSKKEKIGVIGAGIMGLTVAYRLANEGYPVTILEGKEQIGGLSTWFNYGEFIWDKYYHAILKNDEELLNLLDELDLSHHLNWSLTSTGFLWQGQLFSMSNYKEFITFPPLNLIQKFRLGIGILYSHYLQSPEKLEGIPAKIWLIKIFGIHVYNAVWDPLLESKYGTLKEEIPSKLIWTVINRYLSTRNKKDGKESMGYLSGGGLKLLIENLAIKIKEYGGEIFCNDNVLEIKRKKDGKLKITTIGSQYDFDCLISTLPTNLLFNLFPEFHEEISPLPVYDTFLGVIRLALILNESLSPYYVTNLIDKNLPFTGIIELSRLVNPIEFGGRSLVMLPRYDLPDSEWFTLSDEEITHRFVDKLKLTWPYIENNIHQSFVHREKIVQAIRLNGSYPTKPTVSKDFKVWSVNSELIGGESLNNNAIIKVGNEAAKSVIASLGSRH